MSDTLGAKETSYNFLRSCQFSRVVLSWAAVSCTALRFPRTYISLGCVSRFVFALCFASSGMPGAWLATTGSQTSGK